MCSPSSFHTASLEVLFRPGSQTEGKQVTTSLEHLSLLALKLQEKCMLRLFEREHLEKAPPRFWETAQRQSITSCFKRKHQLEMMGTRTSTQLQQLRSVPAIFVYSDFTLLECFFMVVCIFPNYVAKNEREAGWTVFREHATLQELCQTI